MTKKHTKKYTRNASFSTQPTRPVTDAADSVVSSEAKAARVPRRIVEDSDFKPDYTPIVQDLKRIVILAGSFFAILLVLSFII